MANKYGRKKKKTRLVWADAEVRVSEREIKTVNLKGEAYLEA